jgi:surface polysaccharide O-acyltransferase-like enzyme
MTTRLTVGQAQALRWIINGFGWFGGAFIFYGLVTALTGESWPPLERVAEPLSSALTILGTAVVAFSIYFDAQTAPPPEDMSFFIAAPLVIVACAAALLVLWSKGTLPVTIVNGIAMVGLAGALLRIQPNPYLKPPPSRSDTSG